MYAEGRGVPRDRAEAVKWYRMAAEQGFCVSQNNLGVAYQEDLSFLEDNFPEMLETVDPNVRVRFEAAREVSALDFITDTRKVAELAAAADERPSKATPARRACSPTASASKT